MTMKFLVYNADGLTLPVTAEPGLPFKFECGEEECGKRIRMSGVIIRVSEDKFTEVLSKTIEENPDFTRIDEITARTYIFSGEVNGRKVELPAETLEDFAKRFMEEVLILR